MIKKHGRRGKTSILAISVARRSSPAACVGCSSLYGFPLALRGAFRQTVVFLLHFAERFAKRWFVSCTSRRCSPNVGLALALRGAFRQTVVCLLHFAEMFAKRRSISCKLFGLIATWRRSPAICWRCSYLYNDLLQLAGDVRTPTKYLLQLAGDVRSPTKYLLQSAGDVRSPTKYLLQSVGDVRSPTKYLLQLAGDVRTPTDIGDESRSPLPLRHHHTDII